MNEPSLTPLALTISAVVAERSRLVLHITLLSSRGSASGAVEREMSNTGLLDSKVLVLSPPAPMCVAPYTRCRSELESFSVVSEQRARRRLI